MKSALRRSFTLIELVVVIAIIALTLGIAAASMRGESQAQKLERTVHEFSSYCSRVRFRSAEEGVDWQIFFEPEESQFTASPVQDVSEERIASAVAEAISENSSMRARRKSPESDEEQPPPVLTFKLDKSFLFETAAGAESRLASGEKLEVFRFFPDGGAAGGHKLILKLGALQKIFSVSRLTGRIIISGETD